MLGPMTLPSLSRAVGSALGVGLIASACSSKAEPPQAFVDLVMSQGQNSGLCSSYPTDTTIMEVGQPGVSTITPPTQPVRIQTGAQHVQITCSVHPQGTEFAINLDVLQGNVAGNGSSSLTVGGVVDPETGGTNITAAVLSTTGGQYVSSACTIDFNTPGAGAEPAGPPVAAGRIWAHLSCAAATDSGMMVSPGQPATCDVEVDMIFENCGT
jgi:hypothetical protein